MNRKDRRRSAAKDRHKPKSPAGHAGHAGPGYLGKLLDPARFGTLKPGVFVTTIAHDMTGANPAERARRLQL